MEGLIILLMVPLMMASGLLAAAAGIVAAVLSFVAFVVVELAAGLWSGRKDEKPVNRVQRVPFYRRVWVRWVSGAVVGVAVVVVLADSFAFRPLVRFCLDRIATSTGWEVRYDRVDGSFLRGRFDIDGVRITRAAPDGVQADLQLKTLQARMSVLSAVPLLSSRVTFDHVSVAGLHGEMTLPTRDTAAPRPPAGARRDFILRDAQAQAVDVTMHQPQAAPIRLEIDHAHIAPLRRRQAVFDLLFRSNLSARLNAAQLEVTTQVIAAPGRRTTWQLDGVEAAQLAALVPGAPLTWFAAGAFSATVEDEWQLDDIRIDMDWRLRVEGAQIVPARTLSRTEQIVAVPLAALLARQDGAAEVAFRLNLDRERLFYKESFDMTALREAVRESLLASLPGSGAGSDTGSDANTSAPVRQRLRDLIPRPAQD